MSLRDVSLVHAGGVPLFRLNQGEAPRGFSDVSCNPRAFGFVPSTSLEVFDIAPISIELWRLIGFVSSFQLEHTEIAAHSGRIGLASLAPCEIHTVLILHAFVE